MKKVYWERAQKKSEDQKKMEEEEEKHAMALIDWHDFAVVQVINWEDDENESEQEPESRVTETKQPITVPVPTITPTVEPSRQSTQDTELDSTGADIQDVDMEMDDDDDFEPEPQPALKVRHDYQPRVRTTTQQPEQKVITPAGQLIDAKEASPAVKIELANPKARERIIIKSQAERESNLAAGEDISKNLKKFAEQRSDIFGLDKELVESEKKKKPVEKPTWDGHSSSIQRVAMEALGGMSVRQQIKAIHESKGLTGESSEPVIGPKLVGSQPPRPSPQQTQATPQTAMAYSQMRNMTPAYPTTPMHMRPPYPTHPMATPIYNPATTQRMGQVPTSGTQGGIQPKTGGERPPTEEPTAKRQKIKDPNDEITKKLIPEREFLEAHPGPVMIVIKVPTAPTDVKSKWPLHGQTLRIQVLITDPVKVLKQKLGEQLGGMPINKQKLRVDGLGYLKDSKTLAFYNANDGFEVELGVKERGGRKK